MKPKGVILCPPTHYRVDTPRNPFTLDASGKANEVDGQLALTQWQAMRDAFAEAGLEIRLVEPRPDLPDQVFTANPVRTAPDGRFVRATMTYPERAGEVDLLAAAVGGADASPSPAGRCEGGGDLLWHRGTLLAGYGFRSDRDAVLAVADALDVGAVLLQLVDERFYHLDTALCVLDDDSCLWVPAAFDAANQAKIEARFTRRFVVPDDEALRMAANAFCFDGRVFIEQENPETIAWLQDNGFTVVALDTSEFRKAGGSVFCMKQEFW